MFVWFVLFIFIFNVVGIFGKLGIVKMLFVNVMINFVLIFGISLWIVIVNFFGCFNFWGLLESEYCVFVM